MLVKEFVQNQKGKFSPSFYNSLPILCSAKNCGFPMLISPTLTKVECANPRCPNKVTLRLRALFKTLGIKYIPKSSIYKYVTERGILNPLEVFNYDYATDGLFTDEQTAEECQQLTAQLQNASAMTLATYLKLAFLPNVKDCIDQLVWGVPDIDTLYDNIEKQGVYYIQKQLGKESETIDVQSSIIYTSLMQYKLDLLDDNGIRFIEVD